MSAAFFSAADVPSIGYRMHSICVGMIQDHGRRCLEIGELAEAGRIPLPRAQKRVKDEWRYFCRFARHAVGLRQMATGQKAGAQ